MNNPVKTVELVIKFLATTPGRDKTCRIFQYSFKFLKAVLAYLAEHRKQEGLKILSEKCGFISANMSLTRKVLRFGKPIGTIYNLHKLLTAFSKKTDVEDEPRKETNVAYVFFRTAELISSTVYYFVDHILYFARIGVIKRRPWMSVVDFLSEFLWLLESIFGAINNCIHIHILQKAMHQKSIKMASTKERESFELNSECTRQIDACIIEILRNLVDIPVSIGFLKPEFISEGYMGILGTISSYIGCYQNWPSN